MSDLSIIIAKNTQAIDNAITAWADAHKQSVKTYRAYLDTVSLFRSWLQQVGIDLDGDVSQIALVAQAFAAHTTNPNKTAASNTTHNQRLAILNSFYSYALKRYLIMPMDNEGRVRNPIETEMVKRKKVQQYASAHSLVLSPDEQVGHVQAIDRSTPLGKRDYALLGVLLQTGRRLSEVASLQWQHVRIYKRRITLTFEHCKGDKTMVDELPLSISNALLAWLHEAYGQQLSVLDKDAPLWLTLSRNTKQRGQALGTQAIADICEKRLGISKVHVTRHTWTLNMIEAGATLNEIQAHLGHESLATTGRYAAVLQSAKNRHGDKLAKMSGFE